jgi:CHASE2 domain-containing sensor protein/nitrogen-specific signal transduction histidine kinase/DNA-binding NarL/FixJ family response regulator
MQRLYAQSAGLIGAIAIASGLAIVGDASELIRRWEWRKIDVFFQWRDANPPLDPHVTVVTITDRDIQVLKQWPVSDETLAQAIETIAAADPAFLGFDLYRDLPVEPGGDRLDRLFRTRDRLHGVAKILEPATNPPPGLVGSDRIATSDTLLDRDGVLRRALLSLYDRGGQLRFSLGTQAALRVLAERHQIHLEPLDASGTVRLGRATFRPLRGGLGGYTDAHLSLGTSDRAIAERQGEDATATAGSYQILLNFVGPEAAFRRVTLRQVLAGTVDPAAFRDRIVLIGMAADSAKDQQLMPYSLPPVGFHGYLPGVFLHANVASALIQSALGDRPVLKPWHQPWVPLWIITWAIVGGCGTWWIQQWPGKRRVTLGLSVGSWGALVLVLTLGSYGAFLRGHLVPTIAPITALTLASAIAANSYKRQQLLLTNAMLSAANEKLLDYSSTLEQRVRDRTADLEKAKLAADGANRAKSEFLANMSHELRTPLNGIIGYAQILQYDDVTEEQTAGLQTIYQCGVHLLTLINDILDLSKIEADKLELTPTDLATQSFIDGIIDIFKLKAKQKEIGFEVTIDPQVPSHFQADEKRLRQVLINLLGNAVKFTDRGAVALRVRRLMDGSRPHETQGGDGSGTTTVRLRFEVEDTGVGMTPEDAAKVFLPFEQVGEAGKKAEGTGLGLAISYRVVELMGGQLQVKSEFGMGTLFWFDASLPVPVGAQVQGAPSAYLRHPLPIAPGTATPQVLVVDRDAGSRLLLMDLLEPLGFEVREASTLEAAIAAIAQTSPGLIITETILPPLEDGATAIAALRQAAPDSKIMVLSAAVFPRDRQRALGAGGDIFLPKPIPVEELLAQLAQLLHLTWHYPDAIADPARDPQTALDHHRNAPHRTPPEDSEAIIGPPIDQLLYLQDLIRKGDIFRLKEVVADLRSHDPRLDRFARDMSGLADGFELRQLREYIQGFLDSPTEAPRDRAPQPSCTTATN